jgi:hypothetical protein
MSRKYNLTIIIKWQRKAEDAPLLEEPGKRNLRNPEDLGKRSLPC